MTDTPDRLENTGMRQRMRDALSSYKVYSGECYSTIDAVDEILNVMRKPTLDMVGAGDSAEDCPDPNSADVWEVMIETIMEERG